MSKPKTFHLDTASLELPRGAYAGGNRHILSFGDQMEIILEGVGVLSNPVVAESR